MCKVPCSLACVLHCLQTTPLFSPLCVLIASSGHLFENLFLYRRSQNTPIDGCEAMREVTNKCPGLTKPTSIRSRSLRKYLATVSQVCQHFYHFLCHILMLHIYGSDLTCIIQYNVVGNYTRFLAQLVLMSKY